MPTIRGTSPQALRHFTQADQVNQLVSAGEADPRSGFIARRWQDISGLRGWNRG